MQKGIRYRRIIIRTNNSYEGKLLFQSKLVWDGLSGYEVRERERARRRRGGPAERCPGGMERSFVLARCG